MSGKRLSSYFHSLQFIEMTQEVSREGSDIENEDSILETKNSCRVFTLHHRTESTYVSILRGASVV